MATSITTYATLKTYIETLLRRTGDTDVTDWTADFIEFAENELNMDLWSRERISTTTLSISASNKYVAFPSDFERVISLNDNFGTPLQEVTMEELTEARYASGDGPIEFFAVTTRFEFERTHSGGVTYDLAYWSTLDVASSFNNVATYYPMLYVYGALMHAAIFIKDDKRVAMFRKLFRDGINKLNARDSQNIKKLRMDRQIGGRRSFNILKGDT